MVRNAVTAGHYCQIQLRPGGAVPIVDPGQWHMWINHKWHQGSGNQI